jgi:hypothetical protein
MNFDYVIMGSNKDPLYLDFWPVVSKVWKEKFNITPVLGLIDDEDSDIFESEYGLVKKFKATPNIDHGLQSQIVRLYLPKYLEGKCLISDIDMFPTSKKYFLDAATHVKDDNFVIYSSNHPQTVKNKMFPICYVAGHSNVYKTIFDIDLSWDEFTMLLSNRDEKWYTDQKYLFEKAIDFEWKTNKLVLLERNWNSKINNRIDRSEWYYSENLVKEGYYIDCHSLRPYNEYKTEIDKLISLIE